MSLSHLYEIPPEEEVVVQDLKGLPWWLSRQRIQPQYKKPSAMQETWVQSWIRKMTWRRK